MVDVEAIKDKARENGRDSDRNKEQARQEAMEEVEQEASEQQTEDSDGLRSSLKEKAKSGARKFKEKLKQQTMKNVRDMKRYGLGGSRVGKAVKGMAARVQLMAEDTGGAFGSDNRKRASFIDTSSIQDKVVASIADSNKLDLSPRSNMLGDSDKQSDLFGSKNRNPDKFFERQFTKKTSDLLNFGNKKKKKDFEFY